LWHSVGRVLAWVTLLFAVGTDCGQPLQALVGRFGEPGFWTCFLSTADIHGFIQTTSTPGRIF
jgi:hypothetical protein